MGPVHRVASYLGVPLVTADGELFGTLCAIGFRARPRSASRDLPLVETVARMLSTLMAAGMTPADPSPGPDLHPADD
jgi:GAF domain-containing protein